MRKSLFIFILGCIAGVSYVQNEDFKNWADDSFILAKEKIAELFDMAKDSAEDKIDDAKDAAKEDLENRYKSFTTNLEKEADKVKEAKDSTEN